MTQLRGDGSVGGLGGGGNVNPPVRSVCVEAAGVIYRIEVQGNTVTFERHRGMTFTLPLSAVLASAALLFNSPEAINSATSTFGLAPRRPLPPRAGSPWTISEDATLRQEWSAGGSIPRLAHAHGRTKVAIQARLEKLGLVKFDDRQSELFATKPKSS
jgi:hypothetical protein